MDRDTPCTECGLELASDWSACPSCGTIQPGFSSSEKCGECNRLVPSDQPIYCPYCANQLRKVEKETSDDLLEPETIDPEGTHVFGSIRFDFDAISKILSSKGARKFGLLGLLIIAILDTVVIDVIFYLIGDDVNYTNLNITIMTSYLSVLLSFVLVSRLVFNIYSVEITYSQLDGLFKIYAPLFVIKDVLALLLFGYFSIFGEDDLLLVNTFYILTGILVLFIIFHYSFIFSKLINVNFIVGLILVLIIIGMILSVYSTFILPTLEMILEEIIGPLFNR